MADRRIVIGFAVIVLVALLGLRAPSFLSQKREVIASTPTPNAVTAVTPVELKPGARACMQQVTFGPDSQVARVVAAGLKGGKQTPPLELTAAGPGYRYAHTIPGGYSAVAPIEAPLRAPNHSLIGQLCLKNRGPATVVLAGTTEGRTVGRSQTFIDGQLKSAQVSPTLRRANPSSLISRTSEVFAHSAALIPLGPAFVWLLAFALLLRDPALVLWAFGSSLAAGSAPAGVVAPVPAPPLPFARQARRLRAPLADARAGAAGGAPARAAGGRAGASCCGSGVGRAGRRGARGRPLVLRLGAA